MAVESSSAIARDAQRDKSTRDEICKHHSHLRIDDVDAGLAELDRALDAALH